MGTRELQDFAAEYQRFGDERFVTLYRSAMLVRCDLARDDAVRKFETVVAGPSAPSAAASAPHQTTFGAVFSIEKPAGAPYPERIGMGRAPNADVSIPLPRLSKYHAYFSEANGSYTVTDARSKNGSWLDQIQLESLKAYALKDGSLLRFGPYEFRFYTARAFREVVARASTR